MKRLGTFCTILVNFGGKPTGLIRIGRYSCPNLHGYEKEMCITPHLVSIGEIRGYRDSLLADLRGAFDELERKFLEAEANCAAYPCFPSDSHD